MRNADSTEPRFDVWFDDDGRWRLDTCNVDASEAAQIIRDNRDAGYRAIAVPQGTEPAFTERKPCRY